MKTFIAKRLLSSLVTLLVLSMIIFVLVRASGNPAELLYEYPGARDEDIARQAEAWGLNESWPEQYVSFVWNIARFDYGPILPVRHLRPIPVLRPVAQLPAAGLLGLRNIHGHRHSPGNNVGREGEHMVGQFW